MKIPSELTREQLESIVGQIQIILWLDHRTGVLDPDLSWESETLEYVAGVMEDAGLKPGADEPASGTHRGEGPTAPPDTERLRCPRRGERDDLLVRIDSLARLVRGENPDGLSLDLESKSPGDYTWRAFHCGKCGFESAREDFEEPAGAAMRSALEALIRTIEATGGCIRPGPVTARLPGDELVEFDEVRPVPAGDPGWLDLADVYLQACRAMGREPRIGEQDADEIPTDDGGAGDIWPAVPPG
jgi:hypothetical protein